jgi:DNA-binding beta-propeller fold protein YncE
MKRRSTLVVLALGAAFASRAGSQRAAASTVAGNAPTSASTAALRTNPPAARPAALYRGLSSPESVLYDAQADRYLVSNVNGNPLGKDNNGFISVLSPDGKVTALKWIEGGRNQVRLDAPKGLAISGGVLYVADISVVRSFDLATGAPRGEIAVRGSTFLNDLAAGSDGKLYLSDSGPPTGNFDGSGTETVYVIKGGRAKVLAKGNTLGRPNGVAWTEQGLVVCPFGSDEIYRLDAKGVKRDITKVPAGGLAGIVKLGDSLLVTSWQASAIFRGKLGGKFEVALADQKSPADIGYDTKRSRLLVPHFTEDTVEAVEFR